MDDDKLTIVGPEPTKPGSGKTPRRVTMEALLLMAKYNKGFQKKLFDDRDKALKDSGIEFSNSEKLLLTNISNELLEKHIRNFEIKGITRKSLKTWTCAASIILLVSSLLIHCSDSGISGSNTEYGSSPNNKDNLTTDAPSDTVNDPYYDYNIDSWGSIPDNDVND